MSADNWDKVMKVFTILLMAGIVFVFGFGVAVAFIHTVLVEIPDPEGMAPGFVAIILALNTALAVNLGLELGKRLPSGKLPWTQSKVTGRGLSLFFLATSYFVIWAFAVGVWCTTGFKPVEEIVAVIPEVSLAGIELTTGIAVVLIAAQSASPKIAAMFET